jgi:hypothetical protein
MYVKRKSLYSENKGALYSVVWSQCSDAMQAKIKADASFQAAHDDGDSLQLLKIIKGIAFKFESQKNIYIALDSAKADFYTSRQGQDETNAIYLSRLKNSKEVIEHFGGNIGEDPALVDHELKECGLDPKSAGDAHIVLAAAKAKAKAHAISFLQRADKARYQLLSTDLENQYTRGTDHYPSTLTEAYNLLVNYKRPPQNTRERTNTTGVTTNSTTKTSTGDSAAAAATEPQSELTFAQAPAPPPIESVKCYNCQGLGHYAGDCTLPKKRSNTTGVQLLQYTCLLYTSDAADDTR